MNEDLINSAVSFLKDSSVAGSPLAKKIEFLESKGLGQAEIEEALRRANGNAPTSVSSTSSASTPAPASHSASAPPSAPIDYYNPPPPPERSWKDYFIMATATAGVTYGLYQVVTKYLVPSILPPSQSSIEQDKQKIDEEFIKIDKILEQLSDDQGEIKKANETKLQEIDVVIDNVNDFLSKYNKDKLKFDDDLRLMKLEIDNLSNSVEKNMNLTRSNIKDELKEINEELQSLKQLLKNRAASQASTNESRKIAPVSSIPSASEILKRAKAKSESPVIPSAVPAAAVAEAKNAEPKATSPAAPAEPSQPLASSIPGISTPVSVGGVTSAGIPAWQLRHKESEEAAGITSPTAEEKVQQKIDKIGVPAWQLNSSKPAESKSDTTQNETSEKPNGVLEG